jgi:hypothetical protein
LKLTLLLARHELQHRAPGTRDGGTDLQAGRHARARNRALVDLHWPCAAAMLEAGLMNEQGEWLPGKDLVQGFAAYHERLESLKK